MKLSRLQFAMALTGIAVLGAPRDAQAQRPRAEADQRRAMVEAVQRSFSATRGRGLPSEMSTPVIAAMRTVERHQFVPQSERRNAYQNRPLPIGYGQTISQPYIVAYMTAALQLGPEARVLEIGTGSGYQTAVLAELVAAVFTIETVSPLAAHAAALLRTLGYANVHVRDGDGYGGWPEQAPFDAIIVTAAPDHIPDALVEQLQPGGRLVIPIGDADQELYAFVSVNGVLREEARLPVRFVPLTRRPPAQ